MALWHKHTYIHSQNNNLSLPGMVAQASNPSTQKTEARREPWVPDQSRLHNETLSQQTNNNNKKTHLLASPLQENENMSTSSIRQYAHLLPYNSFLFDPDWGRASHSHPNLSVFNTRSKLTPLTSILSLIKAGKLLEVIAIAFIL